MTDKQKDDALSFANKLAEESDEKKVNEAISKVDKFKDNKVIKGLWDNILILIEVIKSPLFQRTVSIGAIAAILYLVSPIDIIPDIILGVGLLDDAFIISTMVAGVVKNIKKDPIKAIRFIDSLPSHLKDTAAKLFGVTADKALLNFIVTYVKFIQIDEEKVGTIAVSEIIKNQQENSPEIRGIK